MDLSNNKLEDINEDMSFQPPPGLAELYVGGNELTALPMKKLLRLKVLDAKNNQLNFYDELTGMVKNGSRVHFEGIFFYNTAYLYIMICGSCD